jgi:DNA modification methylase
MKRQRNTVHPTMKPVELIDMAMVDQPSKTIVYDSFGGSGSTLISCEKNHKQCRMMELDPKYCDVIIKRWQDFTGKQAILEATGKTFAEVSNVPQPA